jgi:hypothetical protein
VREEEEAQEDEEGMKDDGDQVGAGEGGSIAHGQRLGCFLHRISSAVLLQVFKTRNTWAMPRLLPESRPDLGLIGGEIRVAGESS